MLGVLVRLHDLTGDDLGLAHLPVAGEVGDVVALEHKVAEGCREEGEDEGDATEHEQDRHDDLTRDGVYVRRPHLHELADRERLPSVHHVGDDELALGAKIAAAERELRAEEDQAREAETGEDADWL